MTRSVYVFDKVNSVIKVDQFGLIMIDPDQSGLIRINPDQSGLIRINLY